MCQTWKLLDWNIFCDKCMFQKRYSCLIQVIEVVATFRFSPTYMNIFVQVLDFFASEVIDCLMCMKWFAQKNMFAQFKWHTQNLQSATTWPQHTGALEPNPAARGHRVEGLQLYMGISWYYFLQYSFHYLCFQGGFHKSGRITILWVPKTCWSTKTNLAKHVETKHFAACK